jgi:uroporphyrin-3 C-methyltransferase
MNVNADTTQNPSDAQVPVSAEKSSLMIDSNPSPRRFSWVATVIILVLLLGAAGAALWWQQQRAESTGRIVAARFQQIESQSLLAEQRAREALSLAQSQTEKLDQIDAQVKVARSDFATIEQSWRAFNHGVDDTLRANEVERLILLANQQLSLTGQVAGSIAALEAAEQAIVRFDSPRFSEVGRAIQSDLSRLRATPDVDVSGLFSKLDRLGELLNQAPLLAPSGNKVGQASGSLVPLTPTAPVMPTPDSVKPLTPSGKSIPPTTSSSTAATTAATTSATTAATTSSATSPTPSSSPESTSSMVSNFWSLETFSSWWHQASEQSGKIAQQASSVLTKEFADIVRIRRASDTQSLLMSEEQSISLRSHLRGLVLSAKLAMMMRQPLLWQTELSQISGLVDSRYDLDTPQTKKVLELIAQLKASPVAVQLPSLSDSLNALASLRAKGFTSNQPGN